MAYKMDGEELIVAQTREAFARRNDAFNELRSARIDNAASEIRSLDARTDAEQVAAARALENGDWNEHAQRQRNMAQLTLARDRAAQAKNYFENQPTLPSDPVEALIQSRASEPLTQAWLREHPADALALATGNDQRRQAKIYAADADARAQGYATGTPEYLKHVDQFLGGKTAGGMRQVRVVKQGQAAHGDDQMTRGEYEAATNGSVCWGNDAPPGQRGEPIGVSEYLRRRAVMRQQPGWFDKLD